TRQTRPDRLGEPASARGQEGLTPAPAEILRFARARAARLWHPRLPAEPVERLGVLPDPFERVVAHVLERQRGDPARRVAGPYFPRRCDGHIGARPATHTRLGKLLMIVGEDPDDLERGPEAGAVPPDHRPRRGLR